MQSMGLPTSADGFRWTVLSGCQFVAMMTHTTLVNGYIVAPGTPDTVLESLADFGMMLQSCGPDW